MSYDFDRSGKDEAHTGKPSVSIREGSGPGYSCVSVEQIAAWQSGAAYRCVAPLQASLVRGSEWSLAEAIRLLVAARDARARGLLARIEYITIRALLGRAIRRVATASMIACASLLLGCTSSQRCTGRDLASAVKECDAACGSREDDCFERCMNARCAEADPS